MIDLNEWIRELDEEPDRELIDHEEYQKQLFRDCVLRKDDNMDKREELFGRKRTQEGACGIRPWIFRQGISFTLLYKTIT